MTQQEIIQLLEANGPMTNKELMAALNLSNVTTNNALMKLKNAGEIGRVDGRWELGAEHQGYNSGTKGKILSMVQEGRHEPRDIADALGLTVERVSSEVSRMNRELGLNIKRVYILGE